MNTAFFKTIIEEALRKADSSPCDVDTFVSGLIDMRDTLQARIDGLLAAKAHLQRPLDMEVNKQGVYEMARAAFNQYAGMGPPDLPADPGAALQVQLCRWANTNFTSPMHGNVINALGMGEELGEMATAVLKLAVAIGNIQHGTLKSAQRIRGFDDVEKLRRHVLDAGADVGIFLLQLFTSMRLDFYTALRETARQVLERNWKARPLDAHAINEAGTA